MAKKPADMSMMKPSVGKAKPTLKGGFPVAPKAKGAKKASAAKPKAKAPKC